MKSNCKCIVGINLIDMADTNSVTDLNWQHFSQNMCCASQ